MKPIKKAWLALMLLAIATHTSAQWTWIRGSKLRDQLGVYGTKGSPSTLNDPGARQGPVSWTDASGKLWLFGGDGYSTLSSTGLLNDMWKYDPVSDSWTWMSGDNTRNINGVYGTKGVASASNKPGSRSDAVSWTDASGMLWMFGGYGYPASGPAGYLNDLWRFDPFTNQWTWVGGSDGLNQNGSYGTKGIASTGNIPGSRRASTAWRDASGTLWLFGGEGYAASSAQGYLNDIWRLDPATLAWTWVGGSNLRDQNGIYGTQGTPSAANAPGARSGSIGWKDGSGRIWIFGGYGFPETGAQGHLSDFWRYDPATNQWTWVQGVKIRNQSGVYGFQGITSATNAPGARSRAASVTDASGRLWLFGGEGYPESGSIGDLNDLWRYDPATGQWTWIFGAKSRNNNGVYGTQKVASPTNVPGARTSLAFWDDGTGRLWLFGGYGLPETGAIGRLNDLWSIYSYSLNVFFRDADGDGFGDPNTGILSATAPTGYVANSTDCDDLLANVYPGAPELCDSRDNDCDGLIDEGTSYVTYHRDADGDGYGSPTDTLVSCSGPSPGYVSDGSDCDDTRATVRPGGTEVCDSLDNDCDGLIDEGVLKTWYRDADGDGYGSLSVKTIACSSPSGYQADSTDCDDTQFFINPGVLEVCDGLDNDCDGLIDEGVLKTWYRDADGDGYGTLLLTTQACAPPPGYVSNSTDCDDTRLSVNPGAPEVCDSIDNNCNGQVDEGVLKTWYRDTDGDGYGTTSTKVLACSAPTGYVSDSTDCDDTKASVNPTATEVCDGLDNDCDGLIDDGVLSTWYRDADGDGYGSSSLTTQACAAPTGYVADSTDCDDANASIRPGATEVCDGVDNDCDGLIDESVLTTWYRDADGDGYGTLLLTTQACTAPAGYVASSSDCDDTRASVNPAAAEVCDSIDNDCDGLVDEGVLTTWYRDADGDGYGSVSVKTIACSAPSGYLADSTDCDDTRAYVNPTATEVCDGLDNDCDGLIDDGVLSTWYRDADGDGYGASSLTTQACTAPTGYVADSTDCNDANASIRPGATEVCDGLDNDCDGLVDEALLKTWYRDADGDGYGTSSLTTHACTPPTGYVSNSADCDDTRSDVNPAAAELCDSIDNDCDGLIDEGVLKIWYRDADGDGYGNPAVKTLACSAPAGYLADSTDCDDTRVSVNPTATEVCDSLDNDCDGLVDEVTITTWYRDADGDGYGTASLTTQACTAPTGYVADSTDCNDANASIRPGAPEICDGLDNDCNGLVDEVLLTTWYRDADGDGYGTSSLTAQSCTPPTGYVADSTDCNDANASIRPGATEVCDGIDNDCDGLIDEGVLKTWYRDADGDGYGSVSVKTLACSAPPGYQADSTDCDDTRASVNPKATEICDGLDNDCDGLIDDGVLSNWYRDADGDGYGTSSLTTQACTAPAGYVADSTDCNDANASIRPGATEVCDGVDNNCDGLVDEALLKTWYRDADGDGFGTASLTTQACTAPAGYVANNNDCDDTRSAVNPAAAEVCDSIDNDCDGLVDEGVLKTWYRDADGDGYGTSSLTTQACSAPAGYVANSSDCDDTKATVNPIAPEVCDGLDNDCDGLVDDGVLSTWYRDADGDGYGTSSLTTQACTAPTGYVADSTDCDDANASIRPGATEVCDGVDNNCDGLVDEALLKTWYRDADGDGYGALLLTTQACTAPAGYVANSSDCDDTRSAVNPAAAEVCDNIDNDCDGLIDESVLKTWYRDADGDGYGASSLTTQACTAPAGYVADNTDCDDTRATVNPTAIEICDGLDNNCDGLFEPSAPVILSAEPGRQSVIIDFTPPTQQGGAPILNYEYNLDASPFWIPLSPADNTSPINIFGLVKGRTYQIRIRAVNGILSCFASNPVSIIPDGDPIWTGAVSTEWANPANWATNAIPLPGDDIKISSGLVNYPILDIDRTVGNVILQPGATITLNGNTLSILGTLTGTGNFVGSPTSGLNIIGSLGTIYMSQTTADSRSLGRLTLSTGATATLGSSLQIHDALLVNTAQLDLAGQNLVLRSTATGTARVGDLTGSVLAGATNVTVERYIPQTLGTSNIGRRWRVLTSPILSTTVNKAWQNSGTWNGTTPLSGSTNTMITGNRQGTAATANANGYDFWSSVATGGASICRYVTGSSQGAWGTIPGTLATGAFDAEKAYLLYIRGPRSSTYSTGTVSAPTTLQPTGTLKQGDINVTIAPNTGFTLVGNPYASPLDFDRVYDNPGNSGLIKRQFWVWDAALGDGGNYRLIKYMNGQYLSMPEGAPTTLTSIQSGQGFFVESLTTAGGTLKIFESDKTANAPTPVNVLLGHAGMPGLVVSLRRSEVGYGERVMDEVVSIMHDRYVVRPTDVDDAAHPVDSDGHLAIRASGRSISLDARPLTRSRDTLRLRLQNLPPGTYRFHVRMSGLGTLLGQAWLRDAFARELVPLRMDGGESVVLFKVDAQQDSLYQDRFSLILTARTETARMAPESETPLVMRVWPNPVTGRSFHLQTPELPSGSYVAELYGIGGTLVWRKPWTHGGGGAVMRIDIPWGMPSGRYTIRVTGGATRRLHAEIVVE